jgi:iron complex outermembrane recepter protein
MNNSEAMKCLGVGILTTLIPQVAHGQSANEEIVVTASKGRDRVRLPSLVLDGKAIDDRAPTAVADLFRNLSGLSLRVNSRGEVVVRVRGAEERQTAVFLDGAPLATPWDGRVDLALLPAGLIDRVEVVKGAAPIEYGANAVGGIVDLQTLSQTDTARLRAEAQVGTYSATSFSALGALPVAEGLSVIGGFGLIDRDAERIAKPSSVLFDPTRNRRRTNTDLKNRSIFIGTSYTSDDVALRLSLLNADVERGIAAQGDLDPAIATPRYWRYPDWRLTQLTMGGRVGFSRSTSLRFTVWQQWFNQRIDAYRDATYTQLRSREDGKDRTSGARLVATREFGLATMRLVGSAQTSDHTQTDARTATGLSSDFVASPALRFRQRLLSGGIEVDGRLSDGLKATIGLGIDRAETPLTGDKPAQTSLLALSFSSAVNWQAMPDLKITASLGRRSRFPSPRELFGEALGRFFINSDLKPERVLLGDISFAWQPSEAVTINAALWASDADGTIAQRVVRIGGKNLRQRYNMRGALNYGLETTATVQIDSRLRAEVGIALQGSSIRIDGNGIRPPRLQSPNRQVTAALDWNITDTIDLRAELQNVGPAFDLADNGSIARLPSATSMNMRGFFALGDVGSLGRVTLTASVDNLTDSLILPQLGLPAPGRTFRFGIRLTPFN